MQGVFITGTSTEVGKTFVATDIASQLNKRNVTVIPKKPIESGCIRQGDELIPQDALALKNAANYSGPLSDVCPYRFEPPISPVRAAHLANKILTTEQLFNICLQGSEKGFLLVEGAGGLKWPRRLHRRRSRTTRSLCCRACQLRPHPEKTEDW